MLSNFKISLSLLFLIVSNVSVSQNTYIHSHNDYKQDIPFWRALTSGANSIEIDVFLQQQNLYVAHSKQEIAPKRTIESLYLKPLKVALEMKHREHQSLYLLIDIKSEATTTLNKLITVLKRYPSIINNKNIKIIISGNRPLAKDYSKYPDFIFFDWQKAEKPESFINWEKVAMISLDFKAYSGWNGKGRLTHKDYNQVTTIISKAKATKKPLRFWGTPDSKSAWKVFLELGVDIINTDKPYECVNYIESFPNRLITSTTSSEVYMPSFKSDQKQLPVKNIIFLIGDGNGLAQISSAVLANNGKLSLTQLKSIGLIKTQSADDFITDSAAGGTAFATGVKTNNRAIGTNINGESIKNITEILHHRGFSTGCITTDEITGATPASFYAHQADRSDVKNISNDLIHSKLNLFVGGGGFHFKNTALNQKFKLLSSIENINTNREDKIGVLVSNEGIPSVIGGRGNMLANATKYGLQFLKQKKKPFFLMVEAAQIDSFGHSNNTAGIISETIDFDKAITEALKFADKNPDTLVIITADHETSGFSIPQGNLENHVIEGDFTTHDHTGTMVPVFAYGPQSHLFSGVYENTEIFHKIQECLLKE
ncbi:alkaline phosphatase [Flavivirga abyssicola]|uniref:alkaline phosphatase n=1 Tax=Flavivirga abyssicola TaxID=3063533 RepID=UPI0026E00FDD|nr:alkaline phosphatase [Flavivirga sp. MEBiC07777]WVK13970.1 alkaline phosphatase [Flavivirga sp. MEBiC07777]